jgi:hypothetical protein
VGYAGGPGHAGHYFEWFYGTRKEAREDADVWICCEDPYLDDPVTVQFKRFDVLPSWLLGQKVRDYIYRMEGCSRGLEQLGSLPPRLKRLLQDLRQITDSLHPVPHGSRDFCKRCSGEGSIVVARRKRGAPTKYRICPDCQGEGWAYHD